MTTEGIWSNGIFFASAYSPSAVVDSSILGVLVVAVSVAVIVVAAAVHQKADKEDSYLSTIFRAFPFSKFMTLVVQRLIQLSYTNPFF